MELAHVVGDFIAASFLGLGPLALAFGSIRKLARMRESRIARLNEPASRNTCYEVTVATTSRTQSPADGTPLVGYDFYVEVKTQYSDWKRFQSHHDFPESILVRDGFGEAIIHLGEDAYIALREVLKRKEGTFDTLPPHLLSLMQCSPPEGENEYRWSELRLRSGHNFFVNGTYKGGVGGLRAGRPVFDATINNMSGEGELLTFTVAAPNVRLREERFFGVGMGVVGVLFLTFFLWRAGVDWGLLQSTWFPGPTWDSI